MVRAKSYADFAPVFQAIGRIFQEVDPWRYKKYRDTYDHYVDQHEFIKLHKTGWRCCFLQTAILIYQPVFPHKDSGDFKDGWVMMAVFGKFEGGYLCLPDLDARVPFQPGDVVVFSQRC